MSVPTPVAEKPPRDLWKITNFCKTIVFPQPGPPAAQRFSEKVAVMMAILGRHRGSGLLLGLSGGSFRASRGLHVRHLRGPKGCRSAFGPQTAPPGRLRKPSVFPLPDWLGDVGGVPRDDLLALLSSTWPGPRVAAPGPLGLSPRRVRKNHQGICGKPQMGGKPRTLRARDPFST